MGRPSADYFKVEVPEEQKNRALKPGDVSLRTIERVNGVFQVTFAWCDMVGVVHEKLSTAATSLPILILY